MSYKFTAPFISTLHNIVNSVSYFALGLFLFLIGFHLCDFIVIPSWIGNLLFIIIVTTPFVVTLITPLFAKKDPLLAPTHFELIRINKWDKKLNKLLKYRKDLEKAKKSRKNKKKKNIDDENENDIDDAFNEDEVLYQDEPSISVSYFQDHHYNEEEINLIGNFNLIKLAPIKIQQQIDNHKDENEYYIYKSKVDDIWCHTDIQETDFNKAKNEFLKLSNKLIDCISFNKLNNLLSFTIIVCSFCLGIIIWVGLLYWNIIITTTNFNGFYIRCNTFPNGTYPSFGTY